MEKGIAVIGAIVVSFIVLGTLVYLFVPVFPGVNCVGEEGNQGTLYLLPQIRCCSGLSSMSGPIGAVVCVKEDDVLPDSGCSFLGGECMEECDVGEEIDESTSCPVGFKCCSATPPVIPSTVECIQWSGVCKDECDTGEDEFIIHDANFDCWATGQKCCGVIE